MQYFELLSERQIAKVHETTLDVMEEVGLDFHYAPARDLLAKAGAKVEGRRVYFPHALVEAGIKLPPSQFTLYARDPDHNLNIGGDSITFVPVNCPPFVADLDQGRREGTLKDFENFVKLTGASRHLDMCSNTLVEPVDIPVSRRHLHMSYTCLKYTSKCFMGSAMGVEGARDTLEMLKIVFGDDASLAEHPRVISIPCSLTPLTYDASMLGALMTYAAAGQPQLINSLTIAGATAPATLAGALVVQNAEILAGVVLTQLVREGTPVVYASGSSNADMRSGALCVGSPEMAINNSLAAQMARYYKLPSRGVGALCDAKMPDAQAGYESMMNLLTAQISGVNFVLHAAGALDTMNCISYEKFVIDEEVIGMVKRIRQGVDTSDEALALEVVREAGPGGQFIDKIHTFKHCRTEFYQPCLSNRASFDKWAREGGLQCMQTANRRWRELLASYEPPELSVSVDRDLRQYMDKR